MCVLQLYVQRLKREGIMAHRLTKITIIVLLICISAVLATAFSLDGVVCAADGKIGVVVTASFENDAKVWNASFDDTRFWTALGELCNGDKVYYSFNQSVPAGLFQRGGISSDDKNSFDRNAASWDVKRYF